MEEKERREGGREEGGQQGEADVCVGVPIQAAGIRKVCLSKRHVNRDQCCEALRGDLG